MPDLTTFGETMLRLAVPGGERLETTPSLDVRTAGAESNVAVAAANLGVEASWLSKLPRNPLGRRVTRELRANGVEPAVTWDESSSSRLGTYYIELGGEPRGTNVVYDRARSAVTTATPAQLAVNRVRDADVFFTSGITPALSGTLLETTIDLLDAARDTGTETVLDINYRASLWSPEAANEALGRILPTVDIVVAAGRDARAIFGYEGDPLDVLDELHASFEAELTLLTRGADGVLATDGDTQYQQDAFPVETVDPIGSGDALVGGFLAGRLRGMDLADALEVGAATAALSRTLTGDMAIVSWDDVNAVRAGDAGILR